MKNILYLHASAELYGSDYVLLSLLKKLDRNQFNPLVILPFKGPLCEALQKIKIKYLIYDLPVLRRQLFSIKGLFQFTLRFFISLFYLARIISKYKIDIIHTNTAAVWCGGVIAKVLRKRHIWQVLEIVEKPWVVSYVMSKMVGFFSDDVFTHSMATRQHFLKHNPHKEKLFHLLYHGVDLEEYDWKNSQRECIRKQIGLDEDTVIVGMAGRINHWKGHDLFVEAVPEVLRRLKDKKIHFLMLGSCFRGQGHYRVQLVEQINHLSLRNKITLVGFQKNFADWLSAMDIFVLPSKLPEPNATVTIAAMAMKLPVIGANNGGTKETIVNGETGFLIEPRNPMALAEKVVALYESEGTRKRMGENGYLRIQKYFSVSKYSETIMEAYLT